MPENTGRVASAVVVGGGIVGLSCALRLRARGMHVTVMNVGAPQDAASWGNAGHIAVEQVMPLASPQFLLSAPGRLFSLTGGALDIGWRYVGTWLPWCLRYIRACGGATARRGHLALRELLSHALPAWRRMACDLDDPGLLIETGHLMLWNGAQDPLPAMRAVMSSDHGTATVRPMAQHERESLVPLLGHVPRGGLVFDGTAQVRAPALVMEALRNRLHADSGCELRQQRVIRVTSGPQGPRVFVADGTSLSPDVVVMAAGVGTRDIVQGWTPPLIAERGYHVEWDHGGAPVAPPMIFADHSVIVSRFGPRMRASTFVEFTRADAPPDPRKWQSLERVVQNSGLPVRSNFSRWVGCRPTLPDYLPAIGPIAGLPGVIAACGHQHLGLTLAPFTADLVAAIATHEETPLDLHAFRPDRFGRAQANAA
ncbi:NAD(P)/FAD-dependent oxidoreductase [Gluconacetobacter entanii]|uniref:FAD dependent oxidoreductase domain-containing protein n=1 Tax=Gluconacetobacter entanii TaxID=108528 RepID=A0A318PSX1_9PROT|nr:FAD-binding oxidoreductase [Gluconacetobacter entanii]MCE2577763.1 FAD-binding oxidoreductase [Komagataeibacter sp. FNDCR1]PYD63064.1 hypothetical protein CFR72_09045 [Gluconacetobacter entanii]